MLTQMLAVTWISLLSLSQRWGSSLAGVMGIAGVVAVLVAVLSIGEGFRAAMTTGGAADTALVFRGGTDTEMNSFLTRAETRIIAAAPGIRREADGALVSAEMFVIVDLPKRGQNTPANVPVRGVEPTALAIRKHFKLVAGRPITPGYNELMVGIGAVQAFSGLELGSTLRLGESTWSIVGHFSTQGGIADSELWGDVSVLQPAYRRGEVFQAVYAKLDSAAAFTLFKDALTADPRLDVKVIRESDYLLEQSTMLVTLVNSLGSIVTTLMAIGAVFGALNTLYTAVAARSREIAILRTLGFQASAVVVSVLIEAMVLAVLGGILGGGLAWVLFDGYRTATLNWQSFSQVAFAFRVTWPLLWQGVAYAVLIGLIGGLFPAVRAARQPLATALRAL